jgi:hypothetical protein
VLIGVVVAVGTGIVGWSLLSGGVDINLDFDSFRSSEEASVQQTTAPVSTEVPATPAPTPGLPTVPGSPFSLTTLENAWKGKGMTLYSGGAASGFGAQTITAAAVRAERGGESAALAVLVYPDSKAVRQDWNLSAGSGPSAAGGRTVPSNQSTWWNQNVVVVFLSGSQAIGNDAKAALLAL